MSLLAFAFALNISLPGWESFGPVPLATACPDRPSVLTKHIVLSEGDDGYDEFRFHSTVGQERLLLKHLKSRYEADCNSVQAVLGHYTWQQDTLFLYKFWCHDGDYTGKEWGAYRARYKWVCDNDDLEKIDAIVYLESLSDEGGWPLSTEEMKDHELVRKREDFKRHTGRREDAVFVIGKEARSLVQETKSAMKSILRDAEASFVCSETGFGCRVWE